MAALAERFYHIKTKTGGNREKHKFEHTFGMPEETLRFITMPGTDIKRIFGELGFAVKLAESGEGRTETGNALSVLEKSLEIQGVLTRDACGEAEKALLPLASRAKEFTILCASHAHIDMNWMWSWQETVAAALATFRTILSMMKEYPDFTFSQSQASVYELVERYEPDLMGEMKKRIQEGRWEVTASEWVETDKNMPCTESLLRHIRYTRDYLSSVWGVNPDSLNIDFSPDTFGHSANIPEIDNYGNVKYMYHCRGLDERYVLYRWRSPSGSELLNYCEPCWYNGGVKPDIGLGVIDLANLSGGLKTSLMVYGVGDHGGGPTRRDIEQILEMQTWPVFPSIKFGTFGQFFRAAETVREKLPIINREINFFSTGCYTTQSRMKLGNRHGEAALLDAEALNTMSSILGGKRYPEDKLVKAWRGLLFTHFHDILTGSTVRDSRDWAMGRYSDVMAAANAARERAAIELASRIDTSGIKLEIREGSLSEGAGAGYGIENYSGFPCPERGRGPVRIYHLINPSAHERKELTELTVWDWDYDLRRVQVTDHAGTVLPSQLLDTELVKYWDHTYFRILVEADVPASGYQTLVVRESGMGDTYPYYFHPFPRTDPFHRNVVLENEYLKAEFNSETGALYSLFDKEKGAEQIAQGKEAGLILYWAEKATNSAWTLGRYLGHEEVKKTIRLSPWTGNTLRNGLEIEQKILRSTIVTTVSLDKNARALSYSFRVTWNEAADDYDSIPVLSFALPLARKPESYQTDIPGGVIRRAGDCHDYAGLQYMAAVKGNEALAFVTDCKYGYRGSKDMLSVTFLNSSCNPDPFPERGEHRVKLWIVSAGSDPKDLWDLAGDFCHNIVVTSGGSHGGKLPPRKEMLKLDASSTIITSSGFSPEGDLLLRFNELSGNNDKVILTLGFPAKSAEVVDLDGNVKGTGEVAGDKLSFRIPPHSIRALRIKLEQ
jgi:alpha-mannosidase